MKKVHLLCIIIVSALFTYCETDDDNSSDLEVSVENIAGVYNLTDLFAQETETETFAGQSTVTIDRTRGTSYNATATFTSAGTITYTGSYDYIEETIVNGTVTDTDMDTENFNNSSVSYSVNSNNRTITINSGGDQEIWNVQELSANKLIIVMSEVDTDYSFQARIEFTRQ